MNVLAAMAGVTDGEFCKKFTRDNVDIITIGGFNADAESFKAGLELSAKTDRQEFLTCPHHLSIDISENIEVIRKYNPAWKGKVMVNLRGTDVGAYKLVYNNEDIDILEVNCHCRQEHMVNAGAGQALLKNTDKLSEILEDISNNYKQDVSVKIRANVHGVDTLEIVDLIESYDVKYLHVDAYNPGEPEADYDIINKISDQTNMHLIGNNSITSHEAYLKMLDSGADSVSIARALLDKNINDIF